MNIKLNKKIHIIFLLSLIFLITSCAKDENVGKAISSFRVPFMVVNEKEEVVTEVIEKKVVESKPVSITIASKGKIDVKIVEVGDDSEGRMETIPDATTITWYRYSSIPGNEGQSWLAGHNTWGGEETTFGEIASLPIGDIIEIKYEDGSKIDFSVAKVETFHLSNVPDEYLDFAGEERTTLITCAGVYESALGGSQSRTFVTLKRVN